jgi:nitrile hydratase
LKRRFALTKVKDVLLVGMATFNALLRQQQEQVPTLDAPEKMQKHKQSTQIIPAEGEKPLFKAGEQVRVAKRFPIGHYRVPHYIRGKRATVERVIGRAALNNEEEGFGRNAGSKRHYYRVALPMAELWPDYKGPAKDSLRIEIFETWLERV